MSEERKKFFQSVERGEKNVIVEFRVFGGKNERKKSSEKKKSKFFLKILLSSCHWLGAMLIEKFNHMGKLKS